MNLTLLIYLADISGAFKTLFLIFGVILSMSLCLIIAFMSFGANYYGDHEQSRRVSTAAWAKLKWAILSWVIGILLPSQNTVYLMAAAEIGADIAATQEMEKIRVIINQKLDEMLDDNS